VNNNNTPNIFDLDTLDQSFPSPATTSPPTTQHKPATNVLDDLDFFSTPTPTPTTSVPKEVVLPAERGAGMQISAAFARRLGQLYLDLSFTNHTGAPLSDIAIQFNKNSFGLAPAQPSVAVIMPGSTVDTSIVVSQHPNMVSQGQPVSNVIQIATKNNVGVYYYSVTMPQGLVQ